MKSLNPKVCGKDGGRVDTLVRTQNVNGEGNQVGFAEKDPSLPQVTKPTSGFTYSE